MGKRRKTTQQFTDEAITVHRNKYDYDHVDYVNSSTKVTMVGTELAHQKHSPLKDFSGRTECFSLEAKDLILNHLIHYLFDEQELEKE